MNSSPTPSSAAREASRSAYVAVPHLAPEVRRPSGVAHDQPGREIGDGAGDQTRPARRWSR